MNFSTTLPRNPGLFAAFTAQAVRRTALRLVIATLLGFVLLTAAHVAIDQPYTADSPLGYNLGLVGGVLMLLLLPYALRKRLRSLRQCGSMRVWFLFHIFAGFAGPLLVLFHSTFRIGSFNGGIALASTLLVMLSGTVGRYFYRRVYRDLSGSRASLEELQSGLTQQLAALAPKLAALAAVRAETERYLALAATPPRGRGRRALHFLLLGTHRRLALRRVRRALGAGPGGGAAMQSGDLLPTIAATLVAAQRAAQFHTYERLLVRWHVIHIPFLYLLVLTAVVHVVAVHAY